MNITDIRDTFKEVLALPAVKKEATAQRIVLSAQALVLEVMEKDLRLQTANFQCNKEKEELRKEIAEHLAENRRLKELLDGDPIYANGAYWKTKGKLSHPSQKGPYCVACFHERRSLVPMIQRGAASPSYICPVCKSELRWTTPP